MNTYIFISMNCAEPSTFFAKSWALIRSVGLIDTLWVNRQVSFQAWEAAHVHLFCNLHSSSRKDHVSCWSFVSSCNLMSFWIISCPFQFFFSVHLSNCFGVFKVSKSALTAVDQLLKWLILRLRGFTLLCYLHSFNRIGNLTRFCLFCDLKATPPVKKRSLIDDEV